MKGVQKRIDETGVNIECVGVQQTVGNKEVGEKWRGCKGTGEETVSEELRETNKVGEEGSSEEFREIK